MTCSWVKVYEITKTENSLTVGNKLYFICKYYSNFFFSKQSSVSKRKTFTHACFSVVVIPTGPSTVLRGCACLTL